MIQMVPLFLLLIYQVHAQCDGEPLALTLGYDTMKIESPGYESNGYQRNAFCQWVVTSIIQDAAVLYGVQNMSVNCAGDVINVYNGNSTSAQRQISDGCTSGLATSGPKPISTKTADSGKLFITFRSDGDKAAIEWGFQIFMISGKSHGSCGNETIIANSTTQYITSPGFPNKYPINKNCDYRIYPEHPLANITLVLHYVDVEKSPTCEYDSITLNGEKLCGEGKWAPRRFHDSFIALNFLSDDRDTRRGYLLSFKQEKVDGSWSPWNASDCTVSCGGGILNRTRRCDSPPPTSDGIPCQGNDTEEDVCNLQTCPVDGSWGQWSNYSECSVSCDGGTMNRTRKCDSPPPRHGGLSCPGNGSEENMCNTQPCPVVDGSWGGWINSSDCSVSCGGGMMNRMRTCDNPPPMNGGLSCPGNDSEEIKCNTQYCPVNGSWGSWSNYDTCSVSCGGGTKNRTRICDSPPPMHGGLSCQGNNSDENVCNTQTCPENEIWSSWSFWGECSNKCEKGIRKSFRVCINMTAQGGGKSCNGSSIRVEPCNEDGGKNCRAMSFYAVLAIAVSILAVVFFAVILTAKLYGCTFFRKPKIKTLHEDSTEIVFMGSSKRK